MGEIRLAGGLRAGLRLRGLRTRRGLGSLRASRGLGSLLVGGLRAGLGLCFVGCGLCLRIRGGWGGSRSAGSFRLHGRLQRLLNSLALRRLCGAGTAVGSCV